MSIFRPPARRGPFPPGRPGRVSYDDAAEQASQGYANPYEWAEYLENQLGRRFPDPYDAVAAEVVRDARMTGPYLASHVVPAQGVAGRRMTPWGTFGRGVGLAENSPRRLQLSRYDQRQLEIEDAAEQSYRYSGRISQGSSSQYVHKTRPILQLRASRINPDGTAAFDALVRVTAGAFGGAEQIRTFILGGGYTGVFDLTDWDSVRVEILGIEAGAHVEFAWVRGSTQLGDQRLYLPARVTAAVADVPQGAFQVVLDAADGGWQWINAQALAVGAQTITVAIASNVASEIMGARFRPSAQNDVMWIMRSI